MYGLVFPFPGRERDCTNSRIIRMLANAISKRYFLQLASCRARWADLSRCDFQANYREVNTHTLLPATPSHNDIAQHSDMPVTIFPQRNGATCKLPAATSDAVNEALVWEHRCQFQWGKEARCKSVEAAAHLLLVRNSNTSVITFIYSFIYFLCLSSGKSDLTLFPHSCQQEVLAPRSPTSRDMNWTEVKTHQTHQRGIHSPLVS